MSGIINPISELSLLAGHPISGLHCSMKDLKLVYPNQPHTGFSSEIGTKLHDWAVGQAGGSCYSQASLSSNDSKTRYSSMLATLSGDTKIFDLAAPWRSRRGKCCEVEIWSPRVARTRDQNLDLPPPPRLIL